MAPVRVSVIIPTFNRVALVGEAITSVLSQLSDDDELIVVDDGSSDATGVELRRCFGDQIRVITTPNRGVAAARNRGVAASHGMLLAFLDSDDMWLPGKLAAQQAYLAAHPQAAICHTEEIWVRNGRRVNHCAHHRKPSGWIFLDSLQRCLVGASTVLMRRDLFERCGGFDESLPACEDYDLWLRISRETPMWLIDEPLVLKRGGHADQLSRRYWGMDRFRVATLTKLLVAGGLSAEQHAAVTTVLRERCAILAAGAAKRGKNTIAARYVELAQHWSAATTTLAAS